MVNIEVFGLSCMNYIIRRRIWDWHLGLTMPPSSRDTFFITTTWILDKYPLDITMIRYPQFRCTLSNDKEILILILAMSHTLKGIFKAMCFIGRYLVSVNQEHFQSFVTDCDKWTQNSPWRQSWRCEMTDVMGCEKYGWSYSDFFKVWYIVPSLILYDYI